MAVFQLNTKTIARYQYCRTTTTVLLSTKRFGGRSEEEVRMRSHWSVSLMLIALIFSVFSGLTRAQETTPSTATFTESDALNIAQQWALLVSQANVAELEKLLDEKYVHIHATALVESKAQLLEAFTNGSRKYDPIKIEEATVRLFGSSAVVTGKFNLKAFVRGKTIEGVNRFGLFLVKIQDGGRVASFQATAIPQQK